MARGLRNTVIAGVLTALGVAAVRRARRQRRPANNGEINPPDTPARAPARDVARWEDEGGSVVAEDSR
jgi:hypothetical protein